MNFIKTFKELKGLPVSTKVNKIANGNIYFFIVAGTIIQCSGLLLVSGSSFRDIKFLYEREFEENTWTTDYNDKEVGLIMIKQIEEDAAKEIESIKAVYIDKV